MPGRASHSCVVAEGAFVSDNWWTDYAQNRRIRGLEEGLSYVNSSL